MHTWSSSTQTRCFSSAPRWLSTHFVCACKLEREILVKQPLVHCFYCMWHLHAFQLPVRPDCPKHSVHLVLLGKFTCCPVRDFHTASQHEQPKVSSRSRQHKLSLMMALYPRRRCADLTGPPASVRVRCSYWHCAYACQFQVVPLKLARLTGVTQETLERLLVCRWS